MINKKNKLSEAKPLFIERMQKLLPGEKDFKSYLKILEEYPVNSIRCNTLKITINELRKRMEEKGWKVKQPFKDFPEVMIIESSLAPGELGRSLEHQLGYYYIQEISSMLPVFILKPKPEETILDLCSAPGSKTTQIASCMNNTGTIIANEVKFGRIKILSTNLQRCGVSNCIITKKDGISLCTKFEKKGIKFDRILVDAPCSGEGTIRSSPKTLRMWNIKVIESLSRLQKALISSAIKILKDDGTLVYSTCTHSPEENEEIVDFVLKNFPEIKAEKISLPLKTREGIKKWQGEEYLEDVKYSCRVYPQDNNTEGFFIVKFRKIEK
jgi:NOL1/NOP2/sun family putative RNA methylase